jgi:2,4-dienoyl-CoA reductase-like NADH-dependent reductase (Old Yellow Enzyme family)
MRNKLFTPLNVGAFDLKHRVVLEWPPAIYPLDEARSPFVSPSGPQLSNGLVIYDPGPLIWTRRTPPMLGEPDHIRSAWRNVLNNAKMSRQSTLARLSGNLSFLVSDQQKDILALTPRDIEKIMEDYVDAAYRAKSSGFDGIELDSSFGSITDRFPMPSTNPRSDRYSGPIAQRMNFVMELVEGLTQVFGRDRVGVRLSPFPHGFEEVRGNVYDAVLSSLHDQEIAYVHLELTDQFAAQALRSSPSAKTLRQAYPGIFIASCRQGLHFAMELVESRWADAVCFSASQIDARFLSQLRQEGLDGSDL